MKFEPKKNTIDFEFPGDVIFTVDPMRAVAKGDNIRALTDEVKKLSQEPSEENLAAMCRNMKATVDLILGEGASTKLFTDDTPYDDIEDVFLWLDNEIWKARTERMERIRTESKRIKGR